MHAEISSYLLVSQKYVRSSNTKIFNFLSAQIPHGSQDIVACDQNTIQCNQSPQYFQIVGCVSF